jgi:sugar transferase EpsL
MRKRLFDILLSSLALIFIMPLALVVTILVLINIGAPVLFIQLRPGLDGKPFKLYKFRTMSNREDLDGSLLPDNQRLTKFGKALRRLSIDELPSLLNVLKGDMSLVGPRPLLMDYLPLYNKNQARRHEVRPGITGWAQINGRNSISWDEKFKLDLWYVDHQSFWLDIKILALTFCRVLKKENISARGHETMPAFKGKITDE